MYEPDARIIDDDTPIPPADFEMRAQSESVSKMPGGRERGR